MKPKYPFIVIISLVILLSISYTVYSFVHEIKRPQIPVLGQIQPFDLLDSEGEDFSFNQLKGKVWIADFFFTTCSDICPIMTKNMMQIERSFDIVKGVSLVSISVNPEQDTPEVLEQYIKKYKVDTKRWHFLTGSREKIRDVAVNSFKLGSMEEPIFHSTYFSLVDRKGLIRGYYDGTNQEEINRLLKETAIVLREK